MDIEQFVATVLVVAVMVLVVYVCIHPRRGEYEHDDDGA